MAILKIVKPTKAVFIKVVKEVSDYRKYLSGKKSSGDSEINLIIASSKLEKALDDPASEITKFLYNLDEYQKIELLRALITNDKAENFSQVISKFLTTNNVVNAKLENVIALSSNQNPKQWFNPLTMKIINMMMHNNKGETLDDFTYARVVKAAISSVPDTVISIHAKRNLIRQINLQFDTKKIDPSILNNFLIVNNNSNDISLPEFKYIVQNFRLNNAEYIVIAQSLLKFINTKEKLYIDEELKKISTAFQNNNFNEANKLILKICQTQSQALNKYMPNLDKTLVDMQTEFEIENIPVNDERNILTDIKQKIFNEINTKFNRLVKDNFTTNSDDKIDKNYASIVPIEFDVIKNNRTLSSAEYIMLSIGVLRNISDVSNIIDERLKMIAQAYSNSNFSQAINLIEGVCNDHAAKLNSLSPNLSKELIELRDKLKLEQYYIDYVESVEILSKSKSSGVVTSSEFAAIEKNKKIDKSEYIMLVVGLLNKTGKDHPDIAPKLNEIRRHYLTTDYNAAHQLINDICTNYPEFVDKIAPNLSQRLVDLQGKCEEVDVMRNYTRRFFENRVGSFYIGSDINYDAINRIIKFFTPNNFKPSVDAKQVLMQFINDKIVDPDKNNKVLQDIMLRTDELQRSSEDYMNRGRKIRNGITNIEKELEINKESTLEIFSKNKGAMRAMQPNYSDELSYATLRNPMPDIHTISDNYGTYVESNNQSAYVASISGHTFFFAALLERYMQSNQDSSTLNEDVNHFIRGITATYVSMGFHSILEVSHVFSTPDVKKILEKHNIHFDPQFSEKILEQSFNDAQAYNAQILLRTALQESLLNKVNIFSMIKSGKYDNITSLMTKGIDLNIRDSENNSLLHAIVSSDELTLEHKNNLIDHLLKNGADLNVVNDSMQTPLMIAVENRQDDDILMKLLNQTSEISPRKNKDTPERNIFVHAMLLDNSELAIKLLNTNKFDPNVNVEVYSEVFIPLNKAITLKNEGLNFLNALLQRDDVDVNKSFKGSIPIFLAIEENNLEALQSLLNHSKIDLNCKNVSGLTITQFAKEMNNNEAIRLIEEAQKKMMNNRSSEGQINKTSPSTILQSNEDLSSSLNNHGPGRHH